MALKTFADDLWDCQIRSDGRAPEHLRQIECEMGIFHPQASGSASFSIGNTKVFAAVYGPHETRSAQRKTQNPDKMTINVEYSSACFASNERKKSTKNDRKSMEVSASLQNLIDNIVVQDTFPGSQVDVYVELIQDDGGSYAASINATTLALVDAGIPIRDYVVACTATLNHSVAMIDINSFERGSGCAELTVGILPSDNQIIVLEQSHLLQLLYLDDVIRVAVEGCKKIHAILEGAVRTKFDRSRDFKD